MAWKERRRAIPFLAGALLPWLPVAWLWMQSPEQVRFGILDYNLRYRGIQWGTATVHNTGVYLAWIDSSHALLLLLLAGAWLVSEWREQARSELRLCALAEPGTDRAHLHRASHV